MRTLLNRFISIQKRLKPIMYLQMTQVDSQLTVWNARFFPGELLILPVKRWKQKWKRRKLYQCHFFGKRKDYFLNCVCITWFRLFLPLNQTRTPSPTLFIVDLAIPTMCRKVKLTECPSLRRNWLQNSYDQLRTRNSSPTTKYARELILTEILP